MGKVLTASCTALVNYIENCQKIDFTANPAYCMTCNSGYRLENGECVDDHCKTYTVDTHICTKCNRGYDFNNQNVCIEIQCDCTQGYLYDSDDKCYFAGKITPTNCPTAFSQFVGCQ